MFRGGDADGNVSFLGWREGWEGVGDTEGNVTDGVKGGEGVGDTAGGGVGDFVLAVVGVGGGDREGALVVVEVGSRDGEGEV